MMPLDPDTRSPHWYCAKHGCELNDDFECKQGHAVGLRDGIPRFVQDEGYAAHFGAQWNRYRLTQLDSFTGKPISEERLKRCLGPLRPRLRDQTVLECGCGAGRFTEVLLAAGALVDSVDISQAVDANAQNFPINQQHRVAQADILQLPFAPRQFDLVLCLGVIQHTPSPETTIRALYEQVRPGGWLVFDHYTYTLGWYTKTAPLFRMVLKRLRPQTALRVTEKMVHVLLPLHKRVSGSRLRSIVYRLSPLLTHYVTYPELPDDIQRQWALLDTHDSLTDWYKHFRTRGQIRKTLQSLGAQEIWCEYGGNGVEARCRRS